MYPKLLNTYLNHSMSEPNLQNNISKPSVPASPEVMGMFGGNTETVSAESKKEPTEPETVTAAADEEAIEIEASNYNRSASGGVLKVLKYVVPYAAVFAIGLFVYYFYFTNFSFDSIFKAKTEVASVSKQKKIDDLYVTEKARFESYIRSYYFDISDVSILDPNRDLSGNGLTSFQKYILGLNPKVYDTLKNNKADSETLQSGTNPLTGEALTDDQKQLIEQFIELDTAVNKKKEYPAEEPLILINPYSLRGESVDPNAYEVMVYEPVDTSATSTTITPSTTINTQTVTVAPNPVVKKKVVVTKPATTTPATNYPNQTVTPKYNKLGIPAVGNYLNIDYSVPGKIEIPSLSLSAPINWPSDATQNDKLLETGTIRVPGTAEPGSLGTSYISGHSSGYAWSQGDYNKIFSRLNDIPEKASIYVYVTDKQGKLIKLTYIVDHKSEFAPSDPEQFRNTADPVLALGTCWPIGGTSKRKVVYSILDKIERK